MAAGEVATIEPTQLPNGWVITASGRISGVTEPGDVSVHYPFPIKELVTLDDALTYGSRAAKARLAVYIGDLGSDTAARAREILANVPTPTTRSWSPFHLISTRSRWSTARRCAAAAPNRRHHPPWRPLRQRSKRAT
ncbi:hypothetical protein I552_9404 [Mycobacterium xenopi 3993]|nr:hypothetical protein I552_9404 [Mycobacterium xenopi 3993]